VIQFYDKNLLSGDWNKKEALDNLTDQFAILHCADLI